jgi:bacteriocin-like protein
MGKTKEIKQTKRTRTADDLAKTSKQASIEMTETELDSISGGPTSVELKYIKIG